jgi:uncharacterized protein
MESMTTNPWLVPITRLRRSHGQRQHETRRGFLGDLKVGDSRVDGGAEIVADVDLDSIDGGIEVSGYIRAPWTGECRRCLRPIHETLDIAVREMYRPHPARERLEDEDTYPLVGEMLDLAPLARDALLLELPVNPLCREDCAGLCPTCGAPREDGPCGCVADDGDPRWAALEMLRQPPVEATD